MHRAQTLALLLAAGLLCSGCASGAISSNYRPVEDLMLIQTIGVDRAAEGVCLSASTGRAGKNEPPQRMTQTGETVLAALDRLQDRTPNAELFYAQTSYLLLGEEAAAAGELAPLLDFIARNPDMRLSAPLFLVRGATAQQAVMDTGDDRTDVTEALTALQKDTALSGAGAAVLFFAAFTGGATPEAPGRARCAMRWCVRTCVLVTLLSVFTIGNLGAGLTAQLNHPFFTLLRNISLFHAVERFGALVIGLWVLPDFVLVAMLLTLAVNCLRAACTRNAQLFARKNPPALVLLCAAAVGAGALLLAQNAFDTDALQTNVVPRLNLALLGLGTVGTYLTGRARKTI